MPESRKKLAIVMTGGGARAAYQVGFLKHLTRVHPSFSPDILIDVSAGAINAAVLAVDTGSFADRTTRLAELWSALEVDDVFRARWPSLWRNVLSWGLRLVSGGRRVTPPLRGLVDTAPLRETLRKSVGAPEGAIPGIAANLGRGDLEAVAHVRLRSDRARRQCAGPPACR